jgi:hypothetical protein
LLPKAYLDAERAEAVGRSWVDIFRNSSSYAGSTLADADARANTLEQSTLRTFLVESNEFKQHLLARGMPEPLAGLLRRTPMSRYLWVIEVVDRRERSSSRPDVLGEVVLDATLTQFEPLDDPTAVQALHIDDFAFVSGLDGAPGRSITLPRGIKYSTACQPIA